MSLWDFLKIPTHGEKQSESGSSEGEVQQHKMHSQQLVRVTQILESI